MDAHETVADPNPFSDTSAVPRRKPVSPEAMRSADIQSPDSSPRFQNVARAQSRGPVMSAEQTQASHGAAGAGNPFTEKNLEAGGASRSHSRRPWLWIVLGTIVAVVVLAVALGVGLGVGLNNNSDESPTASENVEAVGSKEGDAAPSPSASDPAPSASGPPPDAPPKAAPSGKPAAGKGDADEAAPPPKLPDPLPKWDWTSKENKVLGVNIGGLFLMERWLYEDWWGSLPNGTDTYDEWSLSEAQGPGMDDTHEKHFSTWFTEKDMDSLQHAGINMIRVPLGYWPFVSVEKTDPPEPYRNSTQLEHLDKIMLWAWKRKMYVLIDLHGLPGSQNNDQSSGHNKTDVDHQQRVDWYSDLNQQLSLETLNNTLDWVDRHPAKSIVSGITSVNEPKVYDNDDYMEKLKSFYRASLDACKKYEMPLIMHHAFLSDPYSYWKSFFSDLDPKMAILDDHPYPAWFQDPEPTDKDKMTKQICEYGNKTTSFPTPVIMGEWSDVTILNDTQWSTDYLRMQLNVYGWSAGSMFYNFKGNTTDHPVVSDGYNLTLKYSMLTMLEPDNPVGNWPVYDGSMSVQNFTNGLFSDCGPPKSVSW